MKRSWAGQNIKKLYYEIKGNELRDRVPPELKSLKNKHSIDSIRKFISEFS